MAGVGFDQIGKVYADGTRAVRALTLDIPDGEFMVLVGPSGCGKTTALRMLAGLEEISEGVMRIGTRVVNHVPARDRDIAMVFQSYALYPHMSVYDNLAYGLRRRKVPRAEIGRRYVKISVFRELHAGLQAIEIALRHPSIVRHGRLPSSLTVLTRSPNPKPLS